MQIRPIKMRADHRATLEEIERLMDSKSGTPDGDRLEVLTTLVERYESQHEPIEPPDPIDALLYQDHAVDPLKVTFSATCLASLGAIVARPATRGPLERGGTR
jgi:antitoxin component HigA of HigAB toxin-antitoxin module